jgi:4-amino-4-deoxy-L-arabinose transferase-like glycosyltransferase
LPRGPHLALLAALLALFVLTAAQSAGRPFLFDEANFLFQARAVAENGVPYANMGYMGDRGRVTTREQFGLWHPPLYLYLLGANVKLFGGSESAVRGMGIAIMLLTALVVYGLGYTVAGGGGRGRTCGLLATGLFLVSPLTVQSAVVVDIDGTLLLLVVSTWALLYLRWQDRADLGRLAVLGALLAAAFWTKSTTPLALVGVVVVYQVLAGRWRLALRQAAVILGVGLPLFVTTWWLVAGATGMPFEMPFQWTAWELFDASKYTRSWLGDWQRMSGELAPPLVWTSPYLVGAFGALVLVRAATWLRTRRAEPVDFLVLLGGVIFLAYFIKLAANFPKYHVGMLPFWSAALAWWLVDWLRGLSARQRLVALTACIGAAGLHLWLVRDQWMWTSTLVWEPFPLLVALALFVDATGAALAPRWPALVRRRGPDGSPPPAWGHQVAGVLLALFVGWGVAANATQARADYSTNYYYGTRGQREVAAVLDSLGYDGPWVGAKEIAWYASNQYYIDADTFWWLVIAQGLQFEGEALGYDVRVVVPWTTDPHVRYFFQEHLGDRYVQVAEVADYQIWARPDVSPRLALAPADGRDAASGE